MQMTKVKTFGGKMRKMCFGSASKQCGLKLTLVLMRRCEKVEC